MTDREPYSEARWPYLAARWRGEAGEPPPDWTALVEEVRRVLRPTLTAYARRLDHYLEDVEPLAWPGDSAEDEAGRERSEEVRRELADAEHLLDAIGEAVLEALAARQGVPAPAPRLRLLPPGAPRTERVLSDQDITRILTTPEEDP